MMTQTPRIVVIGKTASGKTAFLNNLLQLNKNAFTEHNEMKIVVKDGFWFGDESKGALTAIDSPGAFIETNTKLPGEIISDLFYIHFSKEISKGIDCVFLVMNINSVEKDWDVQFQTMASLLTLIFAVDMKKHFAFVFTHCDPDKKNEWLPKKQEIEKTWNQTVNLNASELKTDFPLIFTSKFTTEGLENIPEIVKKMGRYKNQLLEKIYQISQDDKKTDQDIMKVIEERFNIAIRKDESCNIL